MLLMLCSIVTGRALQVADDNALSIGLVDEDWELGVLVGEIGSAFL